MMEELSERPILAYYIDGRTSLLSFLYLRHFTTTLPLVKSHQHSCFFVIAIQPLYVPVCVRSRYRRHDVYRTHTWYQVPGRCTRRPEDGKIMIVEISSLFFMHSCFVPVIHGRDGGIQHRIEVRVPI